MYAKFDDTGKLGVYDKEGKLLVAGTPNSSEVASFQHPLLDYAVFLMKRKGDWPNDSKKGQRVELIDDSTIRYEL